MVEVTRTLRETFGLSAQKAMYRESEIRRHFPEAWIEDYEKLIPTMTNHPKDRHVLAAAAHAGAKVIVTYYIKDFPRSSLTPYSITVQGPSAFLRDLYVAAPEMVMQRWKVKPLLSASQCTICSPGFRSTHQPLLR
jgi:hypothetical protein